MAKRSVLGLFAEDKVDEAADAMDALASAGYTTSEYTPNMVRKVRRRWVRRVRSAW